MRFLPTVNTLDIDSEWVMLWDEIFLNNSLPVCEELYLDNMKWPYWDLTTSSASLKKLTIYANGFEFKIQKAFFFILQVLFTLSILIVLRPIIQKFT